MRAAVKSKLLPVHPIGDAPEWLHDYAKVEWGRVKALNVTLSEIQQGLFAGYCQSFGRWREAEEFRGKHGDTMVVKDKDGRVKYVQRLPQVGIAQQEKEAMFRAARALEIDLGEQLAARGDPGTLSAESSVALAAAIARTTG